MKKLILALLLMLTLLAPINALAAGAPADGEYRVEAALSGGSGRASVESPAAVTVKDGQATATVIWSSPHYEFMIVDGVQYDPVQTSGNATFVIPIVFDEDMAVQAQTVAMSEPHLVDYTLRFTAPNQGVSVWVWGGGGAAVVIAAAVIIKKKKRA